MTPDIYLAFVAISIALIIVPGPNVLLIVSNSISRGTRHGLLTVAGTSVAMVLQLVVAGVGVTTFVIVLSSWFEWFRWLGAIYLVWIGVQTWRGAGEARKARAGNASFWQGAFVSATNPKTLFFFAAFFPQFVTPGADVGSQIVVLSVTFLVLATVLDSGYALLAGRLRGWLVAPHRARARGRISGSMLVGAGAGLAMARTGQA